MSHNFLLYEIEIIVILKYYTGQNQLFMIMKN